MNRTRSQGTMGTQAISVTREQRTNKALATTITSYTTGTSPLMGKVKEMTDVVIPNYHERSARGEIFVNPFSSEETELAFEGGASVGWELSTDTPYKRFDLYSPGGHYTAAEAETARPFGHVGVALDGAIASLAGTSAAANVANPEFQGLVFLAELREVFQMIRSPLSSYTQFLRAVERAKFKQLRPSTAATTSTGRFLRDNWLAYRYGVRPVMRDIQNFAKAIDTLSAKRPERKTARGFATENGKKDITTVHGAWNGNLTISDSTTVTRSCRSGVLYELKGEVDTFGMNVTEVPSAVWEIMPYSFVFDWFANIGSYVDAITPKFGVTVLGKWTTYRTVSETTRTATRAYTGSYTTLGNGQCTLVKRTVAKSRVPSISIDLVLKPTPLTGDYGKGRVLDLFALADQLLAHKGKSWYRTNFNP